MKSRILIVLVTIISAFLFFSKERNLLLHQKSETPLNVKFSIGKDDPYARLEQEFMMLRDPVSNEIPRDIFRRELEFASRLPKRTSNVFYKGTEINLLTWVPRGPNNVGGRTRALGIDIRTSSPPNVTIIAGGVSGGIWRSTNDGTSWNLVTLPSQIHSVSCLVQDKRIGKQDFWYAGSGEATGNSASGGGSPYRGDGIYKSTDNGMTWNVIPSTSTNTPHSFDQAFDYVHNIAIDQSNTTQDELYVAASNVILRSTDGGTSWSTVRGSLSSSFISDVQVTSTGVVYATIPSGNTNAGIWRSTNGTTWTNITPPGFPTTYYRIVIGIAPSNENIVYFLGETSGGTTTQGHSLWRYDANGSGTWLNRSPNIPAFGNPVGNFDSQGSYDLVIKIKPNDPNFVLLGGTNLYRSTNGFSTSGATTWIGGYSPANNISQYPNQHPDQHAIVFLPGSNIITYTGHDGGVSKTTDITTSFGGNIPVMWSSLNNSYHSTQFYSISLAPESGSNVMMGGLQDNSTYFGNAPGSSNWTDYESGDGTIVEVAPISDNRVYTAYQLGGVRRRTRAGGFLADFTPNGATNQIFVNPIVLDPNNSSLYYYAAGNAGNAGVWRNSNVRNATATVGWTYLSSTSIGYFVTAVSVSTSNNANVVYFGSNTGPIRRIDNANIGSTPTVIDIKGSLPDGYVSCIAIDPTNSNKALLTFSNYNIQSLWYTTNGGTSWTDVEGNLSGVSGPSIRWANIFYVSGIPHYFLATSVGVFSSIQLNGSSTVWTQEAVSELGNVVCAMLDWRDNDGTLAVATHGRGVFTTQITAPLPVELVSFEVEEKNNLPFLNWQTETEVNNYGFEVQRSETSSVREETSWEKIGFVEGSGNSNSPKFYSFKDDKPAYGNISYRLKQIDTDGSFSYSDIVEIEFLPTEFTLSQNYPNPFNPETTIEFLLPVDGNVKVNIYNSLGELVEIAANDNFSSGKHLITWNGSDYSSGIYYFEFIAKENSSGKNFRDTKKMVLMK